MVNNVVEKNLETLGVVSGGGSPFHTALLDKCLTGEPTRLHFTYDRRGELVEFTGKPPERNSGLRVGAFRIYQDQKLRIVDIDNLNLGLNVPTEALLKLNATLDRYREYLKNR